MSELAQRLADVAAAAIPSDPDDDTLPVYLERCEECYAAGRSHIDYWTPVDHVARGAVAAVLRELRSPEFRTVIPASSIAPLTRLIAELEDWQ